MVHPFTAIDNFEFIKQRYCHGRYPNRSWIMRSTIIAVTLASLALPIAPALADPPPWAPAHGRRAHDRDRYYEPRVVSREDRVWRGDDGRYHCRRSDGTTGLLIGGAVGALLGRSLDGGRDRATGTILGAAGGALLGKSIDQGEVRCR
jgi:hypothetical protein